MDLVNGPRGEPAQVDALQDATVSSTAVLAYQRLISTSSFAGDDTVSSALNALLSVQSTLRRHSVMPGLGKYAVMRLIAELIRQAIYALATLQCQSDEPLRSDMRPILPRGCVAPRPIDCA